MPSVKCTVCGKDRAQTKYRWGKLVEKFGSEENLRAKYVCRACRGAKRREAAAKKKESKEGAT